MRLVFLHGPVAAGKLTIARVLSQQVGYPVFHNHLVVDLLTTLFPYGSSPFVELRETFWLDSFDEAAKVYRSLIFTYSPDAAMPTGFATRARQLVESKGGKVAFVALSVSESEQEKRVANSDRQEFHKVGDLETLRAVRKRNESAEIPPSDLTIHTDRLTAVESATEIVRFFGLRPEDPAPRY